MLLLALKIPMDYWIHLLTPFRGSLPANDDDNRTFLGYIKRFGHLAEAGSHSLTRGIQRGGPATMATWALPTWDDAANGAVETSFPAMPSPALATASGQPWGNLGPGAAPVGIPGQHADPQMSFADYYEDDSDTSDEEDSNGPDGERDPEDPDFTAWTQNQIGEYLYQQYERFKRKWRRFAN